MLTLYQFEDCPFCKKVRKKLDSLKLKYKIVEVDRSKKPDEVTSTGGTVPVLKDGKDLIIDSSVIIDYLERKYKK